MLSIKNLFRKTKNIAKKKLWDKVFIMVDVHETILESDYKNDSTKFKYYPKALEALKMLSQDPFYELILWTSCDKARADQYKVEFQNHGIKFKYFNHNPEVPNTSYAKFDQKFYFNIILDDKAGFEAETDWIYLIDYLKEEVRNERRARIEKEAKLVHQKLRGIVSLQQIYEVLEEFDTIKTTDG